MIRKILKATNPDKKKNGNIVNKSTIPSKETRNLIIAFRRGRSGYKRSAVQILRPYSIQKMMIVIKTIVSKTGKNGDRLE